MSYYLGVVRRWHIVTGVALGIGLLHKVIQRWAEARSPVAREKRRITKVMETSTSYQEWSSAASALDELDMATMPKAKLEEFRRHELRLYDARLLEQHRRWVILLSRSTAFVSCFPGAAVNRMAR